MKVKRISAVFLMSVMAAGTAGYISAPALSARGNADPVGSGLHQGATYLGIGSIDQNNQPQSNRTQNSTGGAPASVEQPRQDAGTYVALGDSIAAGAGLASAGGDTRCARSTQAYPYKLAQKRNLTLVHIACSGATAGDLFTRQGVSGSNIAPQLDTAFANGVPKLITITAGANDMNWNEFLRKCARATCGTSFDNTSTDALRAAYKLKLAYVFDEIQRRSNGKPPKVVITGYSNPISNYCKNRQQYVSNPEIVWLNGQRDKLNQAIRDVSGRYSFVRYASMNFDQHSACATTNTWWQGLNGSAPLHPNEKGQQAIADSINRVLGSKN